MQQRETYRVPTPSIFHTIFVPESSAPTLAEMNGDEFMAVDYRRACAEAFMVEAQAKMNWPINPQLHLNCELVHMLITFSGPFSCRKGLCLASSSRRTRVRARSTFYHAQTSAERNRW